jgi:hypothetical protein
MFAAFRERRDLALENLTLRQQVGVHKRQGFPRLQWKDRVFWVVLSRIWPHWRKVLHLIKADTVVAWQRQGFRMYWARMSQRKNEVRVLIQRRSEANPFWGTENPWGTTEARHSDFRTRGVTAVTQGQKASLGEGAVEHDCCGGMGRNEPEPMAYACTIAACA